MAGAGILVTRTHAHRSSSLLSAIAIGDIELPGSRLSCAILPRASMNGGGLNAHEVNAQPEHQAIGSSDAGIDITRNIGAIATLRTQVHRTVARTLNSADAIVRRSASAAIATEQVGITVGAAARTTWQHDLRQQIYILCGHTAEHTTFLAVGNNIDLASPRCDAPVSRSVEQRPGTTLIC